MSENTICLRLSGGLGNQLFQILLLSLFVERFQCSPSIYSRVRSYKTKRDLLSIVVIKSLAHYSFDSLFKPSWANRMLSHMRLGRLPLPFCIHDANIQSLMLSTRRSLYANSFGTIFLDGYFQHCWQESDFHYALNNLGIHSSYDARTYATLHNGEHQACIHVRGTDFLSPGSKMNLCNIDYYSNAVRLLASNFAYKHFLVLSDDPQLAASYCSLLESRFSRLTFSVSPPKGALEDFRHLIFASAKIVSNSTFGFWAMALSPMTSIKVSPGIIASNTHRRFTFPAEYIVDACNAA